MEQYHKYNDLLLKEYPGFIYEVEIYKQEPRSWNLEESNYYSAPKIISDLINFTKYDYVGYSLFKYVNLIAAPSKWLKENAVQVTIETGKEKRKRIKNEKDRIKELKNN